MRCDRGWAWVIGLDGQQLARMMGNIAFFLGRRGGTFCEGTILEKRSGMCYNRCVLWYPVAWRLFSCASFLPKAAMSNRKDKTFQVTILENEYSSIRSIGCFKEKRHGA